jgi:predicted ATP-dependent endonuclease of OLD family
MRKFVIDKDYKCVGCDIYKKQSITINTGLTVLVGCNGMGKTTLINQLQDQLKKKSIPIISFDNLHEGDGHARSKAGFYNDWDFLAESLQSSEGENIILNLGKLALQIGRFVKNNKGIPEFWIFLDAIDSGLSVDNVVDVKEYLFKTIFEDNPNTNVYIIVSANEYELARDENCFDVYNGKYIKFKDYEEYRDFILNTRKEKDKRVYKKRGED